MSSTILNLATRSPIDGTESAVVATSGANWKLTLANIFATLGPSIGNSAITGGTDQCVLFDRAGVVGESAGLLYDYNQQAVTIGDTGSRNAIIFESKPSGQTPVIVASGIDANISMDFFAVGTGAVNFLSNGAFVLSCFNNSSSSVNFFQMIGETAGTGPIIATTGNDTNINCQFFPKGNGGFGYATGLGVGGTVTQLTSRTTSVTLNTICGQITLFNAAPVVGTPQTFTVNNSAVASTDVIIANIQSATDTYEVVVTAVASTSFNLTVTSLNGVTADSPVINFAVIKSSAT